MNGNQLASLVQRHDNGESIERSKLEEEDWERDENPSWNIGVYKYRLKPKIIKPRLKPKKREEKLTPIMVIKDKNGKIYLSKLFDDSLPYKSVTLIHIAGAKRKNILSSTDDNEIFDDMDINSKALVGNFSDDLLEDMRVAIMEEIYRRNSVRENR